jgi:hypothetical protein
MNVLPCCADEWRHDKGLDSPHAARFTRFGAAAIQLGVKVGVGPHYQV